MDKKSYSGIVHAFTTPFSRPSGIVIKTDEGFLAIPLKNVDSYSINDKVTINIQIKKEKFNG